MAGSRGGPVALQVLMFFPRGGSAQVVRSLARAIAGGPSGWRPRIVSGSLGAPGEAGNAATFFAGLDVVPVPYDAAARRSRPDAGVAAVPPLVRGPARAPPTGCSPASATTCTRTWWRSGRGSSLAPGVLDDVEVAHLHHLTPVHEALARRAPRPPGGDPPPRHRAADARPAGGGRARGRTARPGARGCAGGRPGRRAVVASSDASAASAAVAPGPRTGTTCAVIPNGIDPVAFDGHRADAGGAGAPVARLLVDEPRGWTPARPAARQHLVRPRRPRADPAPGEPSSCCSSGGSRR